MAESPPDDVVYRCLDGRTVLVSGGGSGIGEAIVRRFAGQGARVAFLDIADEPAVKLAGELAGTGAEVRYFHCDLTDIAALRTAIDDAARALGPITVLVNNAANDDRHALAEVTPERFDAGIAVNLKHQFFAAQAVAPMMAAAGGGAIVNLGSIAWRLGLVDLAIYTTCKAAVEGMTKSLARELGPSNIRVNAVAPGGIATERQLRLWTDPEGERQMIEQQALKRRLVPDDVARVVLFLASAQASACTAQTLIVDGGWV